jgi:hypothetical protein
MKDRQADGAVAAVDLTASQATSLSATAGLAESLDRAMAEKGASLGHDVRWMASRPREILAELRGPEETDRRSARTVRFVDRVRADAELAGVVHLAALKHQEDADGGDFDLAVIVGQLRRLSGRLEKRSAQAERLNVCVRSA